jgi:hypothetical protein
MGGDFAKRGNTMMKTTISLGLLLALPGLVAFGAEAVRPKVEVQEDVYRYVAADNGAGPLWCHGSTCIVRIGADVYASGLETIPDRKPLNNCRWQLFHRTESDWQMVCADDNGRTREPCPLAAIPDENMLYLSANPTLTPLDAYNGSARPELLKFKLPGFSPSTVLPEWRDAPPFTEHSYRSFAADGPRHELFLCQNIGYTHSAWTFRDSAGKWVSGELKWPWGAEYDEPQPIRVCYPNVALVNRRVYFCGVSDIHEPYKAWRTYKKEITGQDWDYDFRRLFFTWSDDISAGTFHDWMEISSRDKTAGWIMPGDLWVAPDGLVHLVWMERAIDERLRQKFFPDAKQSNTLNYAAVRDGKVVTRRALVQNEEGGAAEVANSPRFQVTEAGRLFVVYYVSGKNSNGVAVSENRLTELLPDGAVSAPVVVPLNPPFTSYFTATVRAGTAASTVIDMLGARAGKSNTISYARIRIE